MSVVTTRNSVFSFATAATLALAAGLATGEPVRTDTKAEGLDYNVPVLPEIMTASFAAPTKDSSTYSNIGASGNTRPYAWLSTFPGEGRQSNMVTMFDTASAGVPDGVDARRIRVLRMVFTACTYPSGPRAFYDPTPDPWQNTLWPGGDIIVYDTFGGTTPVGVENVPAEPRYIGLGDDEDGNKPVELFGVRFNNGWDAASWVESSIGTPGFQNGVYNAEPIDIDADFAERSVLVSMGETAVEFVFGLYDADDNNTYDTYYPTGNFLPEPVDGFDPAPFAVGVSYDIPDGTPGHAINGLGQSAIELGDQIPPGHRLRFEVNTASERVQSYLRGQLELGWMSLMLSQLAIADIGLNGSYSYWMTKEGSAGLPPLFDLDPSTLEFDYIYSRPGDFDGDGRITASDTPLAIRALTDPAGFNAVHPHIDAAVLTDMDGDGDTDLSDIALIVESIRNAAPEPAGRAAEGGGFGG